MSNPFKFLDAYSPQDKDIFFGRDREVELLADLIDSSKLVLVYGKSGVGKTSLIQCGLSKYYNKENSKCLFIRRSSNINHSLKISLESNLGKKSSAYNNLLYTAADVFLYSGVPIYFFLNSLKNC